MKSNEVRVGNFILFSGVKTKVIPQDFATQCRGINCSEIPNFNPIPITEEWIFKAGFVFKNGGIGWDTYIFKEVVLTLVPTNKGKVICYCYNTSKYKPIKSVHDLQNLFFYLTGEELVFSSTEP